MKKLAFMRAAGGRGDRLFDRAIYTTPLVSPSSSTYDFLELELDEGFHTQDQQGVRTTHARNGLTDPTATREPRVGAQFSSLAAGRFFQGFANLHWSAMGPLMARPDHPALHSDWNPGQAGSKEQQRATVYNPWPAAGALYPKAV